MLDACFDPQTSGGLLIAVAEAGAAALVARLHEAGMADAAVIGTVLGPGSGRVRVRTSGRRTLPAAPQGPRQAGSSRSPQGESSPMNCCESEPSPGAGAAESTAGISKTQEQFLAFMNAANQPGVLDARTKRAIAIALSVLARCEPCLKSHLKKAREMGFTQEEIDEAAWMAIAFGGCSAMMFYNANKRA
jgi:AhpD family alkylhydroperoxidase